MSYTSTIRIAVAIATALLAASAPAFASLRFVGPIGAYGNDYHNDCLVAFAPCLTIGHALDKADPGDTIFVLNGEYNEHLVIDKDIIITGVSRNHTRLAVPPDTIDHGRMVLVRKHTTVKISHMTITGGILPSFTIYDGGAGIKNEGTLTLDDTSVRDNSVAEFSGGGILNTGKLTVRSSVISGNSAPDGGGIENFGRLTLVDTRVEANSASVGNGGGLANWEATATLTRTTIYFNTANGTGGGIYNYSSKLTLRESALDTNSALFQAGGLYNWGEAALHDVSVTNNSAGGPRHSGVEGDGGGVVNVTAIPTMKLDRVTFDGNFSWGGGGAFENLQGGKATLTNVTFHFNRSIGLGAGIYNDGGTRLRNVTIVPGDSPGGSGIYSVSGAVWLKNSIVSDFPGDDSCLDVSGLGTIISLGHNLGDSVCALHAAKHDLINVDPMLGPFGNHGGFEKTLPLLTGSPAIDHGTNEGCPAVDETGLSRPQDGDNDGTAICDIGADQYQGHVGDTDQ